VDLLVEWVDQTVERQSADAQHDASRVAAPDPHRDLLIGDRRRRRAGVAKPLPAGLHRVGLLGPRIVVAGALLERAHQVVETPLLLVPALDAVAEAHVLGHVADLTTGGSVALVGAELAGEDPQERALADAVDADQPGVAARREPERDLGEQQLAALVGVDEAGSSDVAHELNARSRHCASGELLAAWTGRKFPRFGVTAVSCTPR
jgi:hypothetical protein